MALAMKNSKTKCHIESIVRWLALILALIPMQAAALSCIAPSVERAFQIANDVDDLYLVVEGQLSFDLSDWPKRDKSMNDKPDVDVPARVTGRSLSRAGFLHPFKRDITLNAQCFGPWCGYIESGRDYILFLRKTDQGFVQDVDPCGSTFFADPKPAQLKSLQRCLNGGRCLSDP